MRKILVSPSLQWQLDVKFQQLVGKRILVYKCERKPDVSRESTGITDIWWEQTFGVGETNK